MHHVHVGTKKAFGSWKLIWIDRCHGTHMVTIPTKLAKELIDSGMPFEG
jgi:sterol desaturase/sphingolipid hydroxylase (fatty acid hydroxylase superfamily)